VFGRERILERGGGGVGFVCGGMLQIGTQGTRETKSGKHERSV
jgi:hypothetical protein